VSWDGHRCRSLSEQTIKAPGISHSEIDVATGTIGTEATHGMTADHAPGREIIDSNGK